MLAPLSTAGAADISQQVVATIPVCFHPIGVAVNPTTDLIYVPCFRRRHRVQVISGTDKHGDRHPPSQWQSLGRSRSIPRTDLVYVTNPARSCR